MIENTAGTRAMAWIEQEIALGRTLYIGNPRKLVKVTPKTFNRWKTQGPMLFKLVNGDLFIAVGKRYNKLTFWQCSLVSFTSRSE